MSSRFNPRLSRTCRQETRRDAPLRDTYLSPSISIIRIKSRKLESRIRKSRISVIAVVSRAIFLFAIKRCARKLERNHQHGRAQLTDRLLIKRIDVARILSSRGKTVPRIARLCALNLPRPRSGIT